MGGSGEEMTGKAQPLKEDFRVALMAVRTSMGRDPLFFCFIVITVVRGWRGSAGRAPLIK